MKRAENESPEPINSEDPPPASARLIAQLQSAVRRAQARKESSPISAQALFAAELEAKSRERSPVELLGSLGKRRSPDSTEAE